MLAKGAQAKDVETSTNTIVFAVIVSQFLTLSFFNVWDFFLKRFSIHEDSWTYFGINGAIFICCIYLVHAIAMRGVQKTASSVSSYFEALRSWIVDVLPRLRGGETQAPIQRVGSPPVTPRTRPKLLPTESNAV